MKIYMDVCCLCRPSDDQIIGRIRLEVTAVQEIIRRCAARESSLVTSEVIEEELSKNSGHQKTAACQEDLIRGK